MKKFIFIFFTISFFLFAHKINIFTYKEGEKIFVEGYFADGKPCKNSEIIVFDEKGTKISEGKTNSEGIFSFDIPDTSKIKIVLVADMGHKVETEMQLENRIVEKQSKKKDGKTEEKQIQTNIDEEKIKKIIEESVEKAIMPVLKEIEKERQRVRIQEVIGGIGYILGVLGIFLYLRGRTSLWKK